MISLAERPVRTPKDLVGKVLAVPPVNQVSVEAMLALNGVDKGQCGSCLTSTTRPR